MTFKDTAYFQWDAKCITPLYNLPSLVFGSDCSHVGYMRAMLLTLLLSVPNWAEGALGIWKVNPARSVFSGDSSPKSVTVRFESHTRGEVFTLDRIDQEGRAMSSSTILYLDGASRDFRDLGCSGTQSSRRVDSQTVEILRKCANGGWTRLVRRLAAHPKDLVLEITEENSAGRRFEWRLILEKQ